MTAYRASSPPPGGANAVRLLALSLGAPAIVALGFVAGWHIGATVLRPLQLAAPAEAGA